MGKWTEQDVAKRFEKAVWVLDKLPPVHVHRYANLWPEILRTKEEIANQSEPTPLRIHAIPKQISECFETCGWLRWVEEEERHILWMRATRQPWKRICWKVGCDRTTAWRRWKEALRSIAQRLNKN